MQIEIFFLIIIDECRFFFLTNLPVCESLVSLKTHFSLWILNSARVVFCFVFYTNPEPFLGQNCQKHSSP